MSIVELFAKGGPIMYLLLVCSLSAVAVAIDRLLLYSRATKGAEELIERLGEMLKNKRELATEELSASENMPAKMTKSVLNMMSSSNINSQGAVDIVYGEAAMLLRARLNYLSMIVTMAPLLGLLGTIFGMIQSFNIFNLQAGQPMAITGGIGEALIATAAGLFVAIFALVIHTYLAQRMDVILTMLEKTGFIIQSSLGSENGGKGDET